MLYFCKTPQLFFLQMKKFIIAILAVLYLGTTTGATVHVHYCMDKLAGWSLLHQENDKCGKCGMDKSGDEPNSCCKDEQQFLKNDKDQKSTTAFQIIPLADIDLPVSFFQYNTPLVINAGKANVFSNGPPPGSGISIYKRNCVYRL